MNPSLDFYFFIGSTYTYLSVNRAEAVAAAHGVGLRWQPFNARSIMKAQNNLPFIGKPVKTRYMWRDLERRAKRYGIPFNGIPPYPVDPDGLAGRVAVVASAAGWCPDFARTIYRDWFLEGKAPGDPNALQKQLESLGKDPQAVLEQADSPAIRTRYDEQTQRALELGVFGSPTFVAGDEVFWGDDRMEDAIEWAKARAN